MRILVVNDDGIEAEGLRRLAAAAAELGETWVVAPDRPNSGMSQCITIWDTLTAVHYPFPVPGVAGAFACSGTPADCTDVALSALMPQRPDFILSGINNGYNAGNDIVYSGTIGAAMEGLMQGIPAAAFSHEKVDDYSVTDRYLREVIRRILAEKPLRNRIWNVNFPECGLDKCKGIRWGTVPAGKGFFRMEFRTGKEEKGVRSLINADVPEDRSLFPEGSDLAAVVDGYISVGTVRCCVMP